MANLSGRLVLIGAGKMGTAMLQGWLEAGIPGNQVTIFDPAPPPETMAVIAQHSISHNPPVDSVEDIEAILVAIKPQMVDEVLPSMADLAVKAAGCICCGRQDHCRVPAALWRGDARDPHDSQYTGRRRPWHHCHVGK